MRNVQKGHTIVAYVAKWAHMMKLLTSIGMNALRSVSLAETMIGDVLYICHDVKLRSTGLYAPMKSYIVNMRIILAVHFKQYAKIVN